MRTAEEKLILQDYKKAVKAYYHNKAVIDIDTKVRIKLDCWAVRMERMIYETGAFIPPQRQQRFIIFFVTAGEGQMKIGDVKVTFNGPTLLIVPGRTIYSSLHAENTKGYALLFNFNFFLQTPFPKSHLLKMGLMSSQLVPFAHVHSSETIRIRNIFEIILDEQDHKRQKKEQLIALKVLELIIICERLLVLPQENTVSFRSPTAVEFLNLIQHHYKEHHSTSFYAKRLHLHPNSLNVVAKRYLGHSAKSTIDSTLIAEARHLLFQTNLSVKEIAYELGFQSDNHFFRFFKKHTGTSPAAYRRSRFENVGN